ncbi:hypothetical protein Pcinc_043287 [Petrolisthes cinctipes]|uniref:Uncharacterized protein n=1 Tax=Petrolisthes cinctipes TaxID=88211 RepID=A0AAE1BFW8_PETCI|nr:hypothetical protein Pcinc_043287 [Petrolisthes cinctipes]
MGPKNLLPLVKKRDMTTTITNTVSSTLLYISHGAKEPPATGEEERHDHHNHNNKHSIFNQHLFLYIPHGAKEPPATGEGERHDHNNHPDPFIYFPWGRRTSCRWCSKGTQPLPPLGTQYLQPTPLFIYSP